MAQITAISGICGKWKWQQNYMRAEIELITSYRQSERTETIVLQLGISLRPITLKDLQIYFEKSLGEPYFSLRDNACF